LAAQPLVPAGYADPLGTFQTNVIGTANLLEAIRDTSVRAAVIVTTDKVYESREWLHPYRETDRLGGHDPYSASKAAAELVTASYRASFFGTAAASRVVTARAGNVIGGGDWADNRLVPDCLRAFSSGEPVRLRYPTAVRPWQHVLEPLSGYLKLAERLLDDRAGPPPAWNFGPDHADEVEVGTVARTLADLWGPGARVELDSTAHPPETSRLSLDNSLARHRLGWQPRWPLRRALQATVDWHRAWLAGADMPELCVEQTRAFRQGPQ
jgi:CDP-glucose 4,6-dehydratase